jgi:hypothetical protein
VHEDLGYLVELPSSFDDLRRAWKTLAPAPQAHDPKAGWLGAQVAVRV